MTTNGQCSVNRWALNLCEKGWGHYLLSNARCYVSKVGAIVFTGGPITCYGGEPYGLMAHVADLKSDNTPGRLMTIQV